MIKHIEFCYKYEETAALISLGLCHRQVPHTFYHTFVTRSRAYSALSWILPLQPCLPIKNNKVICHQIHFVQKLKTVFEERKNTTHSGDLGTLVRNQGPTILLPLPATGALTTETQNKHLYYSRMDGAMWVQWERQAFSLSYRTRTLYYALNINPGGRRVV